ncbi:MAG TPA: LamG-like jellyroll fold domain-containing protein [Patescibacteria group bacterium]|nr:LamG-like jellyroll fold domain-containing protein [Patescibacteria group bacterium]
MLKTDNNSSKFFKGLLLGLAVTIFLGIVFISSEVLAQTINTSDVGLNQVNSSIGLPNTDIRIIIARIIRAALGLLGVVALGLIIYGGYLWMTAGGNDEQIGKAKKVLINSVVGLVIIMSAYAITQFIFNRLVSATTQVPAHCSDGLQNFGESNTDCGGPCPACDSTPSSGCPWCTGNMMYITSLPPAGPACVRNVKPVITFNQNVNLQSVRDNIEIILKATPETQAGGEWQYGDNHRIVIFQPNGDCGDDGPDDCLGLDTDYTLKVKSSWQSITAESNDAVRLNCNFSCNTARGCCGPVDFKTGSGVDRNPPDISIIYPTEADRLQASGATVPVRISFTDDNGMQSVSLSALGYTIDSKSLANCQKNGEVTISWPTNDVTPGSYQLEALGYDWAGLYDRDQKNVNFYPAHCFNSVRDEDEGETGLNCGGTCGRCAGEYCDQNAQCASGYCDLSINKCVDKMRITDISPRSGATSTYVSIDGFFLGENPGHVYFANKSDPNRDSDSDWVEAKVVNCGPSFDNWTPWQVVAELPLGAVSGPIKVKTASIVGPDGTERIFVDTTNDDWGTMLPNFQVTNQIKPGLCGVAPGEGKPGDTFDLTGKNLGILNNPSEDYVQFGGLKAVVVPGDWTNLLIRDVHVPSLDKGSVGIKAIVNNQESNSLRFVVASGISADWPVISELSPGVEITRGGYLTITGNNFGSSRGRVYFKRDDSGENIEGDQDSFPAGCVTTWTNTKIVVKFPLGRGTSDRLYYVVVNNTSGGQDKMSVLDDRFKLELKSYNPPPGICHITPTAGPANFPPGAPKIKIVGEYFLTGVSSGAEDTVDTQFTGPGASRVGARLAPSSAFELVNDGLIETYPPLNVQTGPVEVRRMGALSNRENYAVLACNKNEDCLAGNKCCLAGEQSGFCIASNELCQGETRSGGYIWRFSNQQIPRAPRVVERCEVGEVSMPSPSPSLLWNQKTFGDHSQVCQTALITVDITDLNAVPTTAASNVVVQECEQALAGNKCVEGVTVAVADQEGSLSEFTFKNNGDAQELELRPVASYNNGKWKSNTWYRVALKTSIAAVQNGIVANLEATRPCEDVPGSAYCFVFKTGEGDCVLDRVVVTPEDYWARVLESPLEHHTISGDFPLYYFGNGLSEQECIMMDVNDYAWDWSIQSGRSEYAGIYQEIVNSRQQQIETLQNTVGVGLTDPEDALKVGARASSSTISKVGTGELTINLSRPEVVDYWPKCLEACTNAEVAVKFNTSMSSASLSAGPDGLGNALRLYKCFDENCISKSVNLLKESDGDMWIDNAQDSTIIYLTNRLTEKLLDQNSLYLVSISTSSEAAPNDPYSNNGQNFVWSRGSLNNPSSYAKPYNRQFSWRFKTKAEACVVDRVEVEPEFYTARNIHEKTIFTVQPYSKPDDCSATGQKLSPWNSGWTWESSAPTVATVTSTFTKGRSPHCTNTCIRKGSDVPAGDNIIRLPMCGDGRIEAGEDCDVGIAGTSTSTCGLNCLLKNKTNTGSNRTPNSTDVNASFCGNGMVGIGEDCDIGISGNYNSTTTSFGCNERCLHTGTRLSVLWCSEHRPLSGGYPESEYESACRQAYSQCGDGVRSEDEDEGCDSSPNGWDSSLCNDRCLFKTLMPVPVDPVNPQDLERDCNPGEEGCNEIGQNVGSSLSYATPSSCGDGIKGIGEDASCEEEDSFVAQRQPFTPPYIFNPWSLVTGVGGGIPSGDPLALRTNIIARTVSTARVVEGSGEFQIRCGYNNDSECPEPGYGVGSNTCCYARPLLQSNYPANLAFNVCSNTYLEAKFSERIDLNTLSGNLIIARGTTESVCPSSTIDVTDSVVVLDHNSRQENLPWYESLWNHLAKFVGRIFGLPARATGNTITARRWCAGDDFGGAEVVVQDMASSTSAVVVKLKRALAFNTDYAIVLKDGIRDTRGVSIGKIGENYYEWKFITGNQLCEIDKVEVRPETSFLSRVGATTTLFAYAGSRNNQMIQPVGGYAWEYIWGPKNNDVITITSTTLDQNVVTAQNRNGEVDVIATANITENDYSAQQGEVASDEGRVIVFLCENPWPPKNNVFPFDDKAGNKDYFDLASSTFTGGDLPSPYFNFSTYYCADNGANGTVDDLPYLRPVISSSASDTGRCRLTGNECSNTPGELSCGRWVQIDGNYFHAVTPSGQITAGGSFCADASNSYNIPTGATGYVACLTTAGCTSGACVATEVIRAAGHSVRTWQEIGDNSCQASLLKRTLLTNNKNSDAIGIQVFTNKNHLTAEQWFKADKQFGGQGFTANLNKIKIDGYDAVTDGNNVYVDALNYDSTDDDENLFTNIYLFSINADAREESRKVFSQLLNNLRFNINVAPNKRFCGPNLTSVDYDKPCVSDLDCTSGEICTNMVDKLKRNYERLRDLSDLELGLRNYVAKNDGKYPDLKEGTLLSGQSISTWESWSRLGNAFGFAAPTDPINRLGRAGTCSGTASIHCTVDSQCSAHGGTCIIHDPLTGWSVEGRRFSFSCATSSLAYRYIFSEDEGYDLRAKFEDVGIQNALKNWTRNLSRLINEFVTDGSHVSALDPNGICNGANEIATQQSGRCGDGMVNYNLNEVCDPPNSTVRDNTPCIASNGSQVGGMIKDKICNANCSGWTYGVCYNVSALLCGNGQIDAGEICDEGKELNGKTGHCATDCKSRNLTCGDGILQPSSEFCDWSKDLPDGKTGWCSGSSKPGQACASSSQCNEIWFPETRDGACQQTKYSLVPPTTPSSTCNWDCQAPGPYCGDGIIQAEFGEECEVDASCSIAGQSGKRQCRQCRLAGPTDLAWLNMDRKEWMAGSSRQGLVNSGGYNVGTISCSNSMGMKCPTPTSDSKFGKGAMLFDGVDDYFESEAFLHGANFTLNLWVKPMDHSIQGSHQVVLLEKGETGSNTSKLKKGFRLQFTSSPQGLSPGIRVCPTTGNCTEIIYDSDMELLPHNAWSMITLVKTNSGSAVTKLYINGELVGTGSGALDGGSSKLYIGQSQQQENLIEFKGIMDELYYFNRALSDDEIESLLQNSWFCKTDTPIAPGGTGPAGARCGDGDVDIQTEFCDNGPANGVACTPGYGQSCSYCSNDCTRTIDIQPVAYCGNEIIDTNSPEVCEATETEMYVNTTTFGGLVSGVKDAVHNGYEVKKCQEENVLKRGEKTCNSQCAFSDGCVLCGSSSGSTSTVPITGGWINVINLSDNTKLRSGTLYLGDSNTTVTLIKNGNNFNLSSNIESNPICSDLTSGYNLRLNGDTNARHKIPLVVRARAESWAYDLLLSPVISITNSSTAHHLRLVVSWVGDGDYEVGFSTTVGENAELFNEVSVPPPWPVYTSPFSNSFNGIWYHQTVATANKTHVKTYTLNTTMLSGDKYHFYVRSTDRGIQNLRSELVKVEVYYPEDDSNGEHFGRPVQSYYLSEAKGSLNPDAEYWQVLNIRHQPVFQPPGAPTTVQPINEIKTGINNFTF